MFCPLLQRRSAYRSEVWMFDCCVDELCSDAPDDHIKRLRQKRSSYFSSFCSDSRINVVIVCFSTRQICWRFTSLHVLLFRHKHSVRVQIITETRSVSVRTSFTPTRTIDYWGYLLDWFSHLRRTFIFLDQISAEFKNYIMCEDGRHETN